MLTEFLIAALSNRSSLIFIYLYKNEGDRLQQLYNKNKFISTNNYELNIITLEDYPTYVKLVLNEPTNFAIRLRDTIIEDGDFCKQYLDLKTFSADKTCWLIIDKDKKIRLIESNHEILELEMRE